MRRPRFHPVLSCAEARRFEKGFFAGDTGEAVREAMRRAAAGVAREARALLEETGADARHLAILCGSGRNAGDALLAAGALLEPGSRCEVRLAGPREALCPEAARALALLEEKSGAEVIVGAGPHDAGAPARRLILDGLAGSGFRPPASPAMRAMILAANADEEALRIAVDLPSGAGDTSDDLLFAAHLTVAAGIVKAPLLTGAVRASAGRLRYADVGFFDKAAPAADGPLVPSPAALRELGGLRDAFSDKRSFGHVAVVGGHRTMPGALLMNVLAALRAGAGLVTAFCPRSVHAAFAAAAPEAMWVPLPETAGGALSLRALPAVTSRLGRADALVCGSGLGDAPESLALAAALLERSDLPVVLDADALRAEVLEAASRRAPAAGPVVITPHAGEFRRLAGVDAGEGFGTLADFARRSGTIVVHKGPGTRVTGEGREFLIPYGGPALARGGSGDLLAGMLGALLAREQGRPRAECAALAAAWHGAAADLAARRHGASALRTTDLLAHLGPCLRARED